MKKLILMCFVVIFFITGCDKEKNNQILITNNYNAISLPIFIPNSKPTIKQKIKMDRLADNKVTNITIESNADGLIEKVLYDDESLNMSIDYHNKTTHYDGIDAMLELDKNNNVTSVLGKNYEQLASLSYNKSGQLIKQEDIMLSTKEKHIQAFGYYNNKTMNYAELREKYFYLNKFYYSSKGVLIESISSIYTMTNDKSKTDNAPKPDINVKQSDRKPENLKPNDVKCIYLNHNKYGDWENGYCMRRNGVRITKYTRELEY